MVVCDNGCRRHSVCDHSVLRQPHSRLRNKHLHSRLAINNYTHGKIQQLRSRQRATTTLTVRSATTLTAKDAKQPTSGETFSSFAASVVAVSVARKLNPVPANICLAQPLPLLSLVRPCCVGLDFCCFAKICKPYSFSKEACFKRLQQE